MHPYLLYTLELCIFVHNGLDLNGLDLYGFIFVQYVSLIFTLEFKCSASVALDDDKFQKLFTMHPSFVFK